MEILTADYTLEQILKKYEDFALNLSQSLKTKVTYEYWKEVDEEGKETGKIFSAYIRQPHILAAAKCMDMLLAKRFYEAGALMWESMVLPESDTEVKTIDKYKLGLEGRLGLMLQVQAPEDKKK